MRVVSVSERERDGRTQDAQLEARARQSLGSSSDAIRATLSTERDKVTSAMARGLVSKCSELHKAGELEGIIAVGGMTGTLICLPAMKGLPFGLPKILVSSAAALPRYADYYAQYFSMNDITVMHSEDRKSTRLNSSHSAKSRMPSSA